MHMWRENCMTIFKIFKRDFPKVLKNAHSCLLLSGTQLWGEVTPGAIFGDCRLRGVGVVRGVSLPSLIYLTRRPNNTGHTTV